MTAKRAPRTAAQAGRSAKGSRVTTGPAMKAGPSPKAAKSPKSAKSAKSTKAATAATKTARQATAKTAPPPDEAGGHVCYHCKQWVAAGEPHDCWTTTEAVLTQDLSEDLREAWERFRETAADLGEQRIYASHNSIMFARATCYAFVRPKRAKLEVCIFLGREERRAPVRRAQRASKAKVAHLIDLRHRDEVEGPIVEWLQEAYDLVGPSPRKER